MRFALFLGCTIPARLNQYETSSRAVLETVGVELADTNKFNCCGYPLRNIHFKAFVLASVRNLAIAEKMNLNIMTLCKCCYGSLKKADYLVKGDISLRKEMNDTLKKLGFIGLGMMGYPMATTYLGACDISMPGTWLPCYAINKYPIVCAGKRCS